MTGADQPTTNHWPALWALVVGFFMILVDTTIVAVAIPTIVNAFDEDVNDVIWISSAYLLAYAVPLLISGRLGDRYGPKRLFQVGLVIFTLSSLACGLVGSLAGLIIARVVQGLGASLMTPQTMSVITRLFPPNQRGKAMALWGATAGVATLAGPLLGGVLIDTLGWQWIFFINVPVGVVCFLLVQRLVPQLETNDHRFDWIGVVLSAVGLFLIVFGLQEANNYEWGTIVGPVSVLGLIIVGAAVLVAFVVWQHFNSGEPLMPLGLFRDRNFSISNIAISLVGFTVTAMPIAFMFWAQSARGLGPTMAALLNAPMAVVTLVLSAPVGSLVDKYHPRVLATFGTALWGVSLIWLSQSLDPTASLWWLVPPMTLLGLGSSFVWGPLSTAATGNLPAMRAGAGSGVYNATRQVGAVIGSAVIASVMSSQLAAHLGGGGQPGAPEGGATDGPVPPFVAEGISAAIATTLLVPAGVILVAAVVALLYERPRHQVRARLSPANPT